MAQVARLQAAGGALVVVDPRRTPTARAADLHLQAEPGTDLALFNGLLHIALRDGLVDEAFVAERTTGFADVRTAADGDVVCTCNAVTAGALRACGARTVGEAALATRATTGCGTCAGSVAALLATTPAPLRSTA